MMPGLVTGAFYRLEQPSALAVGRSTGRSAPAKPENAANPRSSGATLLRPITNRQQARLNGCPFQDSARLAMR